MKVFGMIVKIVVALAAIAGIIYVAATYGDKIVAWAKKLVGSCKCCCGCGEECECTCSDGECVCDCECTEQVVESETEPIAAEADFEG